METTTRSDPLKSHGSCHHHHILKRTCSACNGPIHDEFVYESVGELKTMFSLFELITFFANQDSKLIPESETSLHFYLLLLTNVT